MAKKCSNLLVGRSHSRSSESFSFFRVMIGPFQTMMYIPPGAAGRLKTMVGHYVHLEDTNKNSWKVELSLVDNSLAFQQGWGRFVVDHNIALGEFVVFKYIGRSNFFLQIFGLNGSERLHFPFKNEVNISTLKDRTLTNDLPSAKRRKAIHPQTTEVRHGSCDGEGLVASEISMSCQKQFTHVKSAVGPLSTAWKDCNPLDDVHKMTDDDNIASNAYSFPKGVPNGYIDDGQVLINACSTLKVTEKRNSNDGHQIASNNFHSVEGLSLKKQARKKSIDGRKVSPTYHDRNGEQKKKRMTVEKESLQNTFGPAGCHSSSDALNNQITIIPEGIKYLVSENGVCYPMEEDEITKSNQTTAAPISVDISAMTTDVILTNEILFPEHEVPVDYHVLDDCDALINNPSSKNILEDVLCISPHVILEEAPSIANETKCITDAGDSPGSAIPTGGISDNLMAAIVAVPSDENALQCFNGALECPGSPKPIGVEGDEVLALPEMVRFSFSVDPNVQSYQELPSSLPIRRIRLDRKLVFFQDSSKKVWPILYHESEKERFTGFCTGWSAFASANGIKGGENCVLELASDPDAVFDVHISGK